VGSTSGSVCLLGGNTFLAIGGPKRFARGEGDLGRPLGGPKGKNSAKKQKKSAKSGKNLAKRSQFPKKLT